uniref:Uncharacterized protein n=1 Tax=Rhizophora mucronata TaxID=61149 RepID=A0A2P2NH61_RHIMU
MHVGVCVS